MTTDAKCIAVVLSLILILKEQYKENNKMKLKDVMMRAKCGVLGALVATGLTAFAAEPEAVQLWENGPYWATSNLGESESWYADRPEYGALYTFDEAGAAVKSILGEKWRVPSKADIQRLISDCEWVWDINRMGILFTGKGAYASNSIFLPAAGWDTGGGRRSTVEWCEYWTSSKEDAGSGYGWSFVADNADGPETCDHRRDFLLSVRAVRDTPPPPPVVRVDKVTLSEQWDKITVNYTLSGIVAEREYAVVFEVTAGGRTASVTNNPARLTDGMATRVVDTEKFFGGQFFDEIAKVKVSLMKVVGARRLWKGGPYWAECNVGGKRPGDYGDRYSLKDMKSSVSAPWRLPSKDEFNALLSNSSRQWVADQNSEGVKVHGCRFWGKGEFFFESVFLPFDESGLFESVWEGSCWAQGTGDYLHFDRFLAEMKFNSSSTVDMAVRAVCDTPPLELLSADEGHVPLHSQPLEYVDTDGTIKSRPVGGYEFLTDNTATIGGGRWYAVVGTISRGTITVNGSAHLVLCDGAKLIVNGTDGRAGIAVGKGKSLDIWGQTNGTGELTANGSGFGAGIGGDTGGAGGTVTINGGTVTAGGGSGIGGGGDYIANVGDGGVVTINGGTVTATGRYSGAGIGGGYGGSGGVVTINGGMVTATGDYNTAGIGGGYEGAGGTVTINGGTVTATGWSDFSVGIGGGYKGPAGAVTINGGNVVASSVRADPANGAGEMLHEVKLEAPSMVVSVFDGLGDYGLNDVYPVDGKYCFYLPDGSYRVQFWTADDRCGCYSFTVNGKDVVCPAPETFCEIVIGLHPGLTVTWTSGDGTVSHKIDGTFFTVPSGTTNVRVSFAAQPGRVLEGASTVSLGTVNGSVTFGGASGPSLPTVKPMLPAGYVPLDWIASDGGQYIDTEYVHTANTRVECAIEALTTQHSGWSAVFGARNGSFRSNAFCFFAASDGRGFSCPRYNRSGVETPGSDFPVGKETVLICNGLTASWQHDFFSDGRITATGGRTDAGVNTMFVFNLNTAGAGGKLADPSGIAMKLYGFQVFEGESSSPVRDFVPCVDPFCRPGLYDLANGKFCSNAGTGGFEFSDSDVFRTVTVGSHPHVSVSWTFGDGTVTNRAFGNEFKVKTGTENVQVFFMSECEGLKMIGPTSAYVGTVSDDVTFSNEQVPVVEVEYVDADGSVRTTKNFELVDSATSEFQDGHWYLARGSISRGPIAVHGTARLILEDGCSLSLQGDRSDAALEVAAGNGIVIYGQTSGSGTLKATGGYHGAGIGGCETQNAGTITINGGRVNASGDSTGIGGGYRGKGGTVRINGGTVTGNGGLRVGGNGGTVTINGGNVVASSLNAVPMNDAGKTLHSVTIPALNGGVPIFSGLGSYRLHGVVPVDGKYCFYLPDGVYEVLLVSDGAQRRYSFVVKGKDVVCAPRKLGLTVNGVDIGNGCGDGWKYGDGVLILNDVDAQYVLSGVSTDGEVQVRAGSRCTVDLEDATIYTQGRPAFVVDEGVSATLRMNGGVSHLAATNAVGGDSVSAIEVNGTLNVDFAPDADPLQSEIYAFNFGDRSAIGGSGEVSVIGGHLCVWSDDKAIGADCNFHIAESSYGKAIGQVGDDWDDVRLVGSGYLDETEFRNYSKVEIAQVYWVSVPAAIEHVRGITVSNSWEELRYESVGVDGALTNRYCAMLNDTVTVTCEVEDGYVLVGENPQVVPLLTNDAVVLPDVRRPLTITLPETLEGETYAVLEDGRKVEKVGGGGGVAVYPVLSGYDIEIVCTAQEDWRIVSETNVVRFVAIDESKTLAAADLPQAWRLFTVTVPAVEHAVCDVTSLDGDMARTGNGEWTILSNAEVAVTFSADENYRVAANGEKTWTLTGDVVFGETEGFLHPTVEGIPGTIAAPWSVGDNVQAYTNGAGVLTIEGTGAMRDFANAADVPWDPSAVTAVTVCGSVERLGANAFAALDDAVTVNGTAVSIFRFVTPALGPSQPSGAISPAEFERIDIIDGKAYLGVSVYTNASLEVEREGGGVGGGEGEGVGGGGGVGEGEGWGVATNGVIVVPAEGKQGFFYLMSKPAAPSDAIHASFPIIR